MKLLFWGKSSDTHTFIVRGDKVCIYWRNYSTPSFTIKGGEVISQCSSNVIIMTNSPFGKISVVGEGDYIWAPVIGEGHVFIDPTGRRAWFDERFNLLREEFLTESEERQFRRYKKDLSMQKASSFLFWSLLVGALAFIYKIFFEDK